MRIAFTGHRDRQCSPAALAGLAAAYPGAVWVCGGAKGFDRQVIQYAQAHGLQIEIVAPDYGQFGRAAPHVRNRAIVAGADRLVALYDGRPAGGTVRTIGLARARAIPVDLWAPAPAGSGPV